MKGEEINTISIDNCEGDREMVQRLTGEVELRVYIFLSCFFFFFKIGKISN